MGYALYLTAFGIATCAATFAIYSWDETLFRLISLTEKQPLYDDKHEFAVAQSWKQLIKKPDVEFRHVAVGINGDVDLIVKGTQLLKLLDFKSNSSNEEHIDHSSLRSIKDLQQTFGWFHEKGAGGERFMKSYEDFQHILKIAKSIPDVQYFIGGNAALMAQKIATIMNNEGKVLLGCPAGPILRSLIHPSMKVSPSLTIKEDEYHMILEYSKGESWDGRLAPIASRFIFSHDLSNNRMSSMEGFMESLENFKPDLVVLSGFHLLESNEKSFWLKRISEITSLLKKLSNSIPVHLELASMSNKDCIQEIMKKIFPLVSSIGLNEQELWTICEVAGGPHCVAAGLRGPPPVPKAADVSEWMLRTFSSIHNSRLSRVHFHTLPYHITLSLTSSPWTNQESSVLAGTRIAATQACDVDDITQPELVELRVSGNIQLTALPEDAAEKAQIPSHPFDPTHPVVSWKNNGIDLHLSPVLICRQPVKTVGLGDAISAVGLVYSGYTKQKSV